MGLEVVSIDYLIFERFWRRSLIREVIRAGLQWPKNVISRVVL